MASTKKSKYTMKDKITAHIDTWRLYSLIWSGLVGLVGAIIAYDDLPPIKISLLVYFIPVFGWIAALYFMDYSDRNLDLIEKPQRPIPSGKIKPWEAVLCACLFSATGLILSYMLSIYNLILVIMVGIATVSYTKLGKPHGLAGNINRGFITMITLYYGAFAVKMNITYELIFISLIFFFHDASTNIIGALRDVRGDSKGGYKTTPVRYGIRKAIIISVFFSTIFLAIICTSIYMYKYINYIYRFILLFSLSFVVLIFMYILLFKAIKNIDRYTALKAHAFFAVERNILACAFIFGIIHSLSISIFIFIMTVVPSVLLQLLIRTRYEIENTKKLC